MFAKHCTRNVANWLNNSFRAHCDDGDFHMEAGADDFNVEGGMSLIQEADEQLTMKNKLTTPKSFESVKNILASSANVNSFDGFRLMVVKQVNCNTASQHT